MNIKKIVVPLFVTLSGVLVVDKSYSAQVIKVIDFAEINEFNDGLIDGVHLRLHKNEDLAYFPLINHNSDTNKVFAELIKAYGVKFNDKPNFKIHEESSYIDFTCFDCVIRDHHDEVLIEQPINKWEDL